MISNYDKYPSVDSGFAEKECSLGWAEIASFLKVSLTSEEYVLCVDCYPGTFIEKVASELTSRFQFATVIYSDRALRTADQLRSRFDPELTDDPVFGRISCASLEEFFDEAKLQCARAELAAAHGRVLVIGTGAALVALEPTLLVFADMPRWELQKRQRSGTINNLGLNNASDRSSLKYKRAYFLDWRVADRHKQAIFSRINAILDTTSTEPKMLTMERYSAALARALTRPFRVVPFFDPGPWGGQWMREVCDLPPEPANYAWCFDCVPEENSLLLRFGHRLFETPAINLVLFHAKELLGESVHARFGKEFPIRFDLLDTMGGGNLSLQVHPLTEYIQQHFGMHYTQDESYYMLDAKPGATVWLGVLDGIDRAAMQSDLLAADRGGEPFRAEAYINSLPAVKHDHFMIPAGTVHCSGAGSMVLEISATPFIFTFKMWDWQRLGLDGRPRPTHLQHAFANIQWDRTPAWVNREIAPAPLPVAHGDGWREERTGLHNREFIETRRHWFTKVVSHQTHGTVHVLNLVEGREVIVESPSASFEPFVVHYAETFVVPASVSAYTIRPFGESIGCLCATIRASVRDGRETLCCS